MRRLFLTVAALLVTCAGGVQAGNFPERPIRLIVPFAAGGSTDVLARVLSVPLAEQWGYPVVVSNVPGDDTIAGTKVVAAAPPDGHTLLLVNAALAINEAFSRDLPYHALRSFAPISVLAGQPLVLVVNAGSPLRTMDDLIAKARNSHGALSYGTSGVGSLGNIAGELLRLMASVNVAHAPQKSPRAALAELVSNRIAYAIVALPPALPNIKSGQVRAIAVAGSTRTSALPDVPTIGTSIPGYNVSTWIGLLAPHGASVQLMRKLSGDVQTVMRRPDLVEMLGSLGYDPRASTPGEFENRLRADIERYSRVVFEAGAARPSRPILPVSAEADGAPARSSGAARKPVAGDMAGMR